MVWTVRYSHPGRGIQAEADVPMDPGVAGGGECELHGESQEQGIRDTIMSTAMQTPSWPWERVQSHHVHTPFL